MPVVERSVKFEAMTSIRKATPDDIAELAHLFEDYRAFYKQVCRLVWPRLYF